jgi:hypothetical protein
MIDIPLPPDGTGVKETFGLNGDANYTCQGNTVTFRFPPSRSRWSASDRHLLPLRSAGGEHAPMGVNCTGTSSWP